MNAYVARQAIFDDKLQVYGYELLFRSDPTVNSFTGTDPNRCSLSTAMEGFYSIGIDAVTGGKPAFVNFTSMLLLEEFATLFPKDLLVIEILETIEPTPEIIEKCRLLHSKGYVLALDDFVYHPKFQPLAKLCKIIKIDFLSNTPEEISFMLQEMATDLNLTDKLFLAEKIESQEIFNRAVGMGFKLFQGFFFCKPVTMSSKQLLPLKMNYLMLIAEIANVGEIDYGRVSDIILKDIALCHKLLRLINSSYYGLRTKVTDIRQAISYIGTKEIKKWIYIITITDQCEGKPDELIRISLIRAFFMEQMAECCQLPHNSETMFLLGLFSLIDVMMEQPIETALSGLNLPSEIYTALTEKKGKLYNLLLLVSSIEKASWAELDLLTSLFDISESQASECYLKAVAYCNSIVD